jgi:hypothetical protein
MYYTKPPSGKIPRPEKRKFTAHDRLEAAGQEEPRSGDKIVKKTLMVMLTAVSLARVGSYHS